jgi:hypothetical protein
LSAKLAAQQEQCDKQELFDKFSHFDCTLGEKLSRTN